MRRPRFAWHYAQARQQYLLYCQNHYIDGQPCNITHKVHPQRMQSVAQATSFELGGLEQLFQSRGQAHLMRIPWQRFIRLAGAAHLTTQFMWWLPLHFSAARPVVHVVHPLDL
mmetsp:Transcript_42571/g.97626  ORF Transcript_42571/g.97626 Transcript_42571/m.97626 type:complete len:113 (+) Transcript_42571:542-880(+)